MAENFGTYPDDTDKYLAQPALLTRSLSPWSLSSPSGADHSYDTSSSLSNEALTGNGTDRALGPPALEDILFNESMLRADNVIPQSNQAPDAISRAAMELSLPGFDDSWFRGLDVTMFPDILSPVEMSSGPQPEGELQNNPTPHRDPGSSRNTPDHDQQPVGNPSYALEDLFANDSWEIDPTVQLGTDLANPSDGENFEFFAADSTLSEQSAVGPRSGEPAQALFPFSSPRAKTRNRRQLTDSTREKVRAVRRVGACLRCRLYKEACDENTPCQSCVKRAASMRVLKQPCYREPLGNVVPFRLSCAGLGQVRATYPKLQWSSGDLKEVALSLISSLGPHEETPLVKLKLRKFVPGPRDNIDLDWNSNGLVKTQKLPAYAISDIKDAYAAYETFLDQCQPHVEAYIMDSTEDEIFMLTLAEAHRYAELYDNEAVRRALKIRNFAVRRVELQQSDLDIPIIDDTEWLHHGQRPLPRFVNYQVDMMANFVIDAHSKVVLKRLKSLIFGKDVIKAWFEVYLLIYLLLSTIEYACQWQLRYSAKRKDTRNYTNVNFVTKSNLEEWEYSAEILIAHFRCIMRGQIPFSNDSNLEESCERAGIDEESIAYLRRMIVLLKSRETEFAALQEPDTADITSPYVWLSKLFLKR